MRVTMVKIWKLIPTHLYWCSFDYQQEFLITMLSRLLRGHLAVTVHVRSHDGHREVWKEEVDRVVPKTPYDFRLAFVQPTVGRGWRGDPQRSIVRRCGDSCTGSGKSTPPKHSVYNMQINATIPINYRPTQQVVSPIWCSGEAKSLPTTITSITTCSLSGGYARLLSSGILDLHDLNPSPPPDTDEC
jgi:hypothetical protein